MHIADRSFWVVVVAVAAVVERRPVQARTRFGVLTGLLGSLDVPSRQGHALPAHWWPGTAHRGLLLPEVSFFEEHPN